MESIIGLCEKKSSQVLKFNQPMWYRRNADDFEGRRSPFLTVRRARDKGNVFVERLLGMGFCGWSLGFMGIRYGSGKNFFLNLIPVRELWTARRKFLFVCVCLFIRNFRTLQTDQQN